MSEWHYYQMDIEKLVPETVLALIRWCNEQDKYAEQDNAFEYDITVGNTSIKSDNTGPQGRYKYNINITDKHLRCFRELERLEKLQLRVYAFSTGPFSLWGWNIPLTLIERWLEKKLNKKRNEFKALPSVQEDTISILLLELVFSFYFTEEEFCQESKEVQTMILEGCPRPGRKKSAKEKIYSLGGYYIFVRPTKIMIEPLYNDERLGHSKKTIAAFRQLCEEIKPIRGFIAHTTDNVPTKIVFP